MFEFSSKTPGIIALAILATSLPVSQVAVAQENFLLSPELPANLTSPNNFSGLYFGVSAGLMNNNFATFYASGPNTYRIPAGAFVGYNYQIYPWLLAGIEAQADVTFDWETGAVGYNALALARLGFLTSDNFALYEMAGVGLVNGRSAYAVGLGIEQTISKGFSIRGNAIAYGQLNAPVGVTNYGGFTMMKIDVGAVWHIDTDTASNPAPNYLTTPTPTTDFTGPYLGAYMGVEVNPDYNFFGFDPLRGWHLTRATQGVIAGWNYALSDWLRAGAEIQAGFNYNTSGGTGWDAEALARVGVVPFEGTMIYGSVGVGVLANRAAYVAGGGVEYAIWGKNTLRLDVQLLGEIQPAPPIVSPGFTATKVTLGALWHLD